MFVRDQIELQEKLCCAFADMAGRLQLHLSLLWEVATGTYNRGNPLCLCGQKGETAKRLAAVAEQYRIFFSDKKVICISAEAFEADLIASIAIGPAAGFLEKFTNCDLLIIENIDFLARHRWGMQELYLLTDCLLERHRMMVFSAETIPHNMAGMEKRNVAQLEGGIVLDV